MMGTKEENKKFLPPSFAKKEKNWTPHESMQGLSFAAWNFYVQNSLSPFLAWTNGMATFVSKTVCHHFWPRRIPLAKNILRSIQDVNAKRRECFWYKRTTIITMMSSFPLLV